MTDIDITHSSPDEEIASPAGDFVRISLPFVGIYNSILNAEIDSAIEREMEWREEEGEPPYTKAEVDLKAIYRSIAEYTARVLGFKTATYAGANSPSYYNYRDDYIFVWVERAELDALYDKYGLDPEADIDELYIALAMDNDELKVEETDNMWYSIALAVFDEWYDSAGQYGSEEIDNNINFS